MIKEKSIAFPVNDIEYVKGQYSKYLNGTLNVTELAFNIKEVNDTDIIQLDSMYIKVAQFNWTNFWTVEVAEYTIRTWEGELL